MASEPLALPLEVIERILFLAFLPTDSDSRKPAPCPPPSTSHLLLVSRHLRQLCLPHFWRAITIAQPNDWVTLFDARTGLLVGGGEGKRRWDWVEELSIVRDVDPPVKMQAVSFRDIQGIALLHDLHLPTYRRLPRLRIHYLPPEHEDQRKERGLAEWERRQLLSQLCMLYLRPDIVEDYHNRPGKLHLSQIRILTGKPAEETADETALRILDSFTTSVHAGLIDGQKQHLERVLRSFKPARLELPVLALSRGYRIPGLPRLDVPTPDQIDFRGHDEVELDDVETMLADVHGMYFRAKCRLLDVSRSVLEGFEGIVLDPKRDRTEWDSTWSWTRGDGSLFEIDLAEPLD